MGDRKLIITGVWDGPLPSGTPKGIELYAIQAIEDLSAYAVGTANNGGGTDGPEFTLGGSVIAGEFIYIVAAGHSNAFSTYFDAAATFETTAMFINGDDAIELFENDLVIDTFGAFTDMAISQLFLVSK